MPSKSKQVLKAAQEVKERGGPWGRPRKQPPENLVILYRMWRNGDVSLSWVSITCGVSIGTVKRWFQEIDNKEE